jgi:cell wall-associated NlpC family hydrolase
VPSPPSDGVAPSAGQVDEYLALTTQHDAALVTLPALRLAVATADAHVSSLTAERAGVDSAIWQIRVTAAVTQGSADDVVRNLYQQGDGGLGAIATVVTAGPEGLITRLDTLQMLNATADGAVDAARVARSDLALALARADALDLSLESARGDVLTAEARLTAAQATVDSLDARLRTLAIVPPQVTVGPDGCPTQDLPATLRDGAELVGAPTLCRAAVKQAATPQAALAISWAFQHLGAAYACGGAGRLLPFRMDCSSFVSRAYHEGAGLATAGDSWAATTRNMVPWDGVPLDPHYGLVAPEALRPGDLVLYDTCPQGGCAYKHVVMYLGSPDGGKTRWMIHTNSCGDVAKIEPFWGFPTTGSRFLVARRVLALPGEKVLVPSPVDARAAAAAAHAAAVTALHVPAV